MFGLCIWMRLDPGFQEWVDFLDMDEFYIGIYILLAVSIFIIIITFVGCGVTLMEHTLGLYIVRQKHSIKIFINLKNGFENSCRIAFS